MKGDTGTCTRGAMKRELYAQIPRWLLQEAASVG